MKLSELLKDLEAHNKDAEVVLVLGGIAGGLNYQGSYGIDGNDDKRVMLLFEET